MGFLSSLGVALSGPTEVRETVSPQHPRDPILAQMFGDPSQISVTPDSAMRVTAVYACVSLISETLRALPLHVYRKSKTTTGKETTAKFTDHPLYSVLHDMPSGGMTSFEWREMQIFHTAVRGDSFARIVPGRDGTYWQKTTKMAI